MFHLFATPCSLFFTKRKGNKKEKGLATEQRKAQIKQKKKFLSNFCTQKFAVSKGSAFGRVWDSVSISFLQGSPCGPLFAKVRRMKLVSFSCPHHLKLDFAESPSAGLRSLHCDYFPFTRKNRTSAFYVVILFCVRSREWAKPILQTFCKNLAGLLSPRPRFLSCRKERNQRFAKEEVSSLETPLRGKTAPLLSA